MNRVMMMGRLVADPEVRMGSDGNVAVAKFRIAVDKRFKKKDVADAPTADFFRITAFGKLGDFVEKWLKQGTKIVLEGRIENDNYKDKNGNMVYQDQIIAESIEFAESKKVAQSNGSSNNEDTSFMDIPDTDNNDLPFK